MNIENMLREKIVNYLKEEPNREYREQIEALAKQKSDKAKKDLNDRFIKFLKFGTAGIRGRMEAGYNRMNTVSVFKFAYAFYLALKKSPEVVNVFIGYDARKNSLAFAKEIATVLASLDFNVHLSNQEIPTPVCAFVTKRIKADYGIMVTASHNPKNDNGIKIYTSCGMQAFGKFLKDIEYMMYKAPLRNEFITSTADNNNIKLIDIDEEYLEEYLKVISAWPLFKDYQNKKSIPVVYSALHGVGCKWFLKALHNNNFKSIIKVNEQCRPDGNFPTINFPNPEEPGAFDLAYKRAICSKTPNIILNDPDADRLAYAVINNNELRKLNGNEMGALLGYYTIMKAKQEKLNALVASSIVSSRMLKSIAQKNNVQYVDALTGFSNIVKKAKEASKNSGREFIFAYEEAYGFLFRNGVLDKDGISAGLRFMEILASLKKEGCNIIDKLNELYIEYGLFYNCQWSFRFKNVDAKTHLELIMNKFRNLKSHELGRVFNLKNIEIFDLLNRNKKGPYEDYANVIIFEQSDYFRFIVRPSGTEPKIKFYGELKKRVSSKNMLTIEKEKLSKKLAIIKNEFMKAFF